MIILKIPILILIMLILNLNQETLHLICLTNRLIKINILNQKIRMQSHKIKKKILIRKPNLDKI